MIYLISIIAFSGIIFILIGMLLLLEATVVKQEDCSIVLNGDEENPLKVKGSATLLSSLAHNNIYLPSACGGGGSCGMCKCKVNEGGGKILPTELAHLSRPEKKQNIRLSCQLKVKNNLKIVIPESIFNIKKYNAIVISNESVATFIKELVIKFDPPDKFKFKAGAYIQMDVPEYEASFKDYKIGDEYLKEWKKSKLLDLKAKGREPGFRAYSLANTPYEADKLMLTVRIATPPPGSPDAEPGFGSSYIYSLEPGNKVTISGPYGDFFVKDTEREMCFIAGGAGMAPIRSQIFDQLNDLKPKRKMTFWYSARSLLEMFYDEDFKKLEQENDNFSYHVMLSRPLPEDNWTGMTGYVHLNLYENYLKDHEDPSEIEYYLCGPGPMIDSACEMLDSIGVEENMIFYDKF